jgi:hypothetical protein
MPKSGFKGRYCSFPGRLYIFLVAIICSRTLGIVPAYYLIYIIGYFSGVACAVAELDCEHLPISDAQLSVWRLSTSALYSVLVWTINTR